MQLAWNQLPIGGRKPKHVATRISSAKMPDKLVSVCGIQYEMVAVLGLMLKITGIMPG